MSDQSDFGSSRSQPVSGAVVGSEPSADLYPTLVMELAEAEAHKARLLTALQELEDRARTAMHFRHQETNAWLGLETALKRAREAIAKAVQS